MMSLLLDTCVFLWLIWDEPPLHARARELIADPVNEVFVSVASVWEAAIKHGKGRLDVRAAGSVVEHFTKERMRHDIASLPVYENELRHLAALPAVHQDPFDRLLVCQAIEHGLTLVTPDPLIRSYPIKTFW
jgi:PIN domain nuclease of toxin-antitoxin system